MKFAILWIKVSLDYVNALISYLAAFNMQISNLTNFGKCQ